uniref:G-protein coupled receptors family 1 profile domain-containing protein n=1 Tax=Anopheles farauti TaxID=69004 RepID=A0A182QT73_9DIPT
MVAVMIVAFMVAWTPYAIFALIEQFGPPELIGPGLAVLPALVAKSSICYNPIIYVGMNTQFRAAFWRVRRSNGVAGRPDSNANTNSRDSRSTGKDAMECSLDFCHWTVRGTRVSISSVERNGAVRPGDERSRERSSGGDSPKEPDRHGLSPKSVLSNPRSPSCVAPVAECSLTDVVHASEQAGVRNGRHQESELSVIHDVRELTLAVAGGCSPVMAAVEWKRGCSSSSIPSKTKKHKKPTSHSVLRRRLFVG